MRVLVCGGREFGKMPRWARWGTFQWYDCERAAEGQRKHLADTLDDYRTRGLTTIIHGCAPGADNLAKRWALDRGVHEMGFPAPWKNIEHPDAIVKTLPNGRKYDANAGPRRNARMLLEGCPDLVLAFEGGRGTDDMIRQAEAAGVPVVRPSPTPSLTLGA